MRRAGLIGLAVAVLLLALVVSRVRFVAAPAPGAAPTAAAPVAPEAGGVLLVPVAGYDRARITDSWGDARGGGTRGHQGTDVMAPGGAPVVAVAPGRVEKLFQSGLGGTTLYLRSADGRWTYYYAHLAGYAPGVHEGQVVQAGDALAYVGDTGDAGPGNFHLHFGMQRMSPGQHWWQGEAVDPYPYLAGKRLPR